MKKSTKFWALGAALVALAPLASCSNDEAVNVPEEPARELAPGEMTAIQLFIPGFNDIATRADDKTANLETGEKTVDDIWFFAYAASSTAETKIVDLKTIEADKKGTVGSPDYGNPYTINMKAGDYHVYVVANVKDYSSKTLSASTSEQDLEELLLNFSTLGTNQGIVSTKLPMAAEKTDITEADGSGVWKLTQAGQSLHADMTLLCAKVRYTILFNLDDFSSAVHYADNADFSEAKVSNVLKQAGWIANATSTEKENEFSIKFDKRTYPTTDTDWTGIADATTPPADLQGTWTESSDLHKRAWQGTIYIPENKTNAKTTFSFTAKTGANFNGNSFSGDFERGNFYDFVAKIEKAAVNFHDVKVYVKVNPWTYQPQTVATW